MSYFPLLVAGPIERATHLLPQVKVKREFNFEKAKDGKFTLNIATPVAQAKYLKIIAQCLDKIPTGNAGAGSPAWLFIDEVMVN